MTIFSVNNFFVNKNFKKFDSIKKFESFVLWILKLVPIGNIYLKNKVKWIIIWAEKVISKCSLAPFIFF